MSDKYNSLKKDIFLDSTYQMLVNPRVKRMKKEGASEYQVISSYFVKNNKKRKCNQLFYDSKEWCVQTDNTPDDKWACVTTDLVNTFNSVNFPTPKAN